MSDLKDMRAQLRALRRENLKPVSRMRKADISAELNSLGHHLADTPSVGLGSPIKARQSRSEAETIKEAKAHEFPVAPAKAVAKPAAKKPVAKAAAAAPAPKKKASKLATLMRLLEEQSSDDE